MGVFEYVDKVVAVASRKWRNLAFPDQIRWEAQTFYYQPQSWRKGKSGWIWLRNQPSIEFLV